MPFPRTLSTLGLSMVVLTTGCPGDGDTDTVITEDTAPPVITLFGDNPILLAEGDLFGDPGAVATDDVDGAVEVVVTGEVDSDRHGTYVLTYTATDAAGNEAAVTRDVVVSFEGQLAITTVGPNLALLGIDADGRIVERSRSDLGSAIDHYSINFGGFSITKHPTLANTVYVTSFNECSQWGVDGVGCWGNARIDRYTYDANTITHDGLAFLMQTPLRLTTPSFDSGSGVTTVPVTNQGSASVTITSVTTESLDEDASFASGCDAVTLDPGQSCDLTMTAGESAIDDVAFDFTTSLGTARGRFIVNDETTTVRGPLFDETLPGLPPCASDFDDAFQVGGCAPTAMAFSADGTRAYVNDDDEDAVVVFSIDEAGDFTFINVSDDVVYQGIAVNGANTALYNGANVLEISGDDVTEVSVDDGGNATEVVTDTNGTELMVTTYDNETLQVWDISTTPLAPTLVSELDPSGSRARFQHHSEDLGQFVTVDHAVISSITFDGTTLVEAGSLDIPVDLYTCPAEDRRGGGGGGDQGCYRAAYRSVQMSADGSMAMASGFVNPYDQDTFDALPAMGFVTSFSVDPSTFALTEQTRLDLDGNARSVLFVETP